MSLSHSDTHNRPLNSCHCFLQGLLAHPLVCVAAHRTFLEAHPTSSPGVTSFKGSPALPGKSYTSGLVRKVLPEAFSLSSV